MWSLIKNIEDDEYDCVPNTWLKSDNLAVFPDKGKSTLVKMAKTCAPPEDGWESVRIKLLQRDYDSYDRCMSNAIRLGNGKRTLTASEGEMRGKGNRNKKKNSQYFPSSESDSDSEDLNRASAHHLPNNTNDAPKNIYKSITTTPTVRRPFLNLSELTLPDKSHKNLFPSPQPMASSSNSDTPTDKSHKNLFTSPQPMTSTSKSYMQTSTSKCRISKKRHTCSFSHGGEPNERIAHQLCEMSRSISSLSTNVKDLQEEVKYLRRYSVCAPPSESTKESSINDPDVSMEDLDSISNFFPLETVESLDSFDSKLKEEDGKFYQLTMQLFIKLMKYENYSRSTAQLLREIFRPQVLKHFTWKGHHRKGHATVKRSFEDLKIVSAIIGAVGKKWRGKVLNIEEKTQKTIAGFVAQVNSKNQASSQVNSQEEL